MLRAVPWCAARIMRMKSTLRRSSSDQVQDATNRATKSSLLTTRDRDVRDQKLCRSLPGTIHQLFESVRDLLLLFFRHRHPLAIIAQRIQDGLPDRQPHPAIDLQIDAFNRALLVNDSI